MCYAVKTCLRCTERSGHHEYCSTLFTLGACCIRVRTDARKFALRKYCGRRQAGADGSGVFVRPTALVSAVRQRQYGHHLRNVPQVQLWYKSRLEAYVTLHKNWDCPSCRSSSVPEDQFDSYHCSWNAHLLPDHLPLHPLYEQIRGSCSMII